MKKKLLNPLLLLAFVLVPAALQSARPAYADVRYCCTTQQIAACRAQGSTATCRPDNICRCLF